MILAREIQTTDALLSRQWLDVQSPLQIIRTIGNRLGLNTILLACKVAFRGQYTDWEFRGEHRRSTLYFPCSEHVNENETLSDLI